MSQDNPTTKENIPESVAKAVAPLATKDELKSSIASAVAPLATKAELREIRKEISSLEEKMDVKFERNVQLMMQCCERMYTKMCAHFDQVVANVHTDLKGANQDQISLHEDRFANHESRIRRLERA